MTRQDWTGIAISLAKVRARVFKSWPPRGGYLANIAGIHDQKLIRAAKLAAIDETAKALAHDLKRKSTRFDSIRFLEIVGVGIL